MSLQNDHAISPERRQNSKDIRYSPPQEPASVQKNKENQAYLLSIVNAQATKQKLLIEDCLIDENGAEELAYFLLNHFQYNSIELHGNDLSPKEFALICESLKGCVHLNSIKVGWNNLGKGAVGIEALAELIQGLPLLQLVELRNNQIGKGAGPYLAAIIKNSKSIQQIDLRWNDLGDTEARFILAALKAHPQKVQVHLGGNRMDGYRISESVLLDICELGEIKHPPEESSYSLKRQKHQRSISPSLASGTKAKVGEGSSPTKKIQSEIAPIIRNPDFANRTSAGRSLSPGNPIISPFKTREPVQGRSSSTKKPKKFEEMNSIANKGYSVAPESRKQSNHSAIVPKKDVREVYRDQTQLISNSPVKKADIDATPLVSNDPQSRREQTLGTANSYLTGTISQNQKILEKGLEEAQVKPLKESYHKDLEKMDEWFINQAKQLKKVNSAKKFETKIKKLEHEFEQEERAMLRELEEERKLRLKNENRTGDLGAKIKEIQNREQQLESLCEKLRNDCEQRKAQIKELVDRIEHETKETETQMQEMENNYESQINSLNFQMEKMEQDIHVTIQQQKEQMDDITNHWETEYRKLVIKCEGLNQTLQATETKQKDMTLQIKQQTEVEEREKTQRALRDIEDQLISKGLVQETPPRDYSRKHPLEGGTGLGIGRTPPTVKQESRPVGIYGSKHTEADLESVLLENKRVKDQLADVFTKNDELEKDIDRKEKQLVKLEEEAEALQNLDTQIGDVDKKN